MCLYYDLSKCHSFLENGKIFENIVRYDDLLAKRSRVKYLKMLI